MEYIYMFVNEGKEVIYVGKTKNIKNRIRQHFGKEGHLEKEAYLLTTSIYYSYVPSANEARIYELYYISKYQPKYNLVFGDGGEISFELPELSFSIFILNQEIKFNNLFEENEYLTSKIELLEKEKRMMESKIEEFSYQSKKIKSDFLELVEANEKLHKYNSELKNLIEINGLEKDALSNFILSFTEKVSYRRVKMKYLYVDDSSKEHYFKTALELESFFGDSAQKIWLNVKNDKMNGKLKKINRVLTLDVNGNIIEFYDNAVPKY